MSQESSLENNHQQERGDTLPTPLNDAQELRLEARNAVADLLLNEVPPHEKKSYRDAGAGGWRVWK